MSKEFNFEIMETIAVLSERSKGWKRELNLVSWNDAPPKFDIRDWSSDHQKMGRGISLSNEEIAVLKETLNNM